MPIRISGLTSGLDTESIVGALVSAYSFKKEKYEKAQTKLSWKQDAWKDLNTKVYSFYTSVSNMRYSSSYVTKKASVSNSSKAKVTAGGEAINGTQTLKVNSLAKTAYITGGKLASNISSDSTLAALGIKTGTDEKATIQVKTNSGGTTKIDIESSMTVNQFISKLNEAGVQANYDSKNHRIFVSGKQSGEAGEFSLQADNALGLDALSKLGLLTDSELNSIGTTSTEGADLIKKQYGAGVATASGFAEWIKLAKTYKDIINSDTATDAEKAQAESDLAFEPAVRDVAKYLDDKNVDWSTLTDEQITAYGKEIYDNGEINSDSLAATRSGLVVSINAVRDAYVKLEKANAMPNETAAEQTARAAAIAEAQAEVDAALEDPTNAKWAEYIQNTFGSKNSDTDESYSKFWSQSDNLALADSVMYRIDLAQKIESGAMDLTKVNTGTKVDGTDAEIVLNGVTYTSSTNSITVNGLTVEALGETAEDEVLSVTVSNDTDALYDKIKDFLSQYNSLMNEMQKLYNADSAKDYEPLTDDEKNEMSESEIEKWEQKIKDSLLRRDTSLSSIISTMTMSMMKTYEINGKTWSLSGTLGIHTLGSLNAEKNEGYAYHIDGDSEDSKTSGKKDMLREALADDPDAVIDFLKQLTSGLYTDLDAKMKSTSVKSVYTVYNDKEMASEYSNYSKLIKTWADRVTDMEDAYYKKFAAMESALAKLQNSSSSITSMLGG
ncbi:flagellar filament capping protein FliD [Pseudobutyrivibrio xylanivorans]|uniref:Flagellar hook-associated protein 2 n=1 Tax=Pseudobutyrivibrio xylanivorans TaxID=185007 RepID=A0A1G5RXJ5_PSEXY|nr:flagellar filament capping protein FliD [Pseudobutyrivibrio xylanivorans]SCZ78763.1 flagellar hook-associated protein 2 [Pseudobutyrivibrio xylanivorans]